MPALDGAGDSRQRIPNPQSQSPAPQEPDMSSIDFTSFPQADGAPEGVGPVHHRGHAAVDEGPRQDQPDHAEPAHPAAVARPGAERDDPPQREEFEKTHECNFAIGVAGSAASASPASTSATRWAWCCAGSRPRSRRWRSLNPPPIIKTLAMTKRGIIIFVGATGTGKSTSLGGDDRLPQTRTRPGTSSSPSRIRSNSCTSTRAASSPSARSASTPTAGTRR